MTTKKTEAIKEDVKESETEKVEVIKEKPVVKRAEPLDPNTQIELLNNTYGTLLCNDDKLALFLEMSQFAESGELLMSELKKMARHGNYSNIIKRGWLYINNEDAVKELRLEKLYKDLINPLDLDELFDNKEIDKIEYLMKNAPIGQKEAIIMKTKEKIHNGSLDSIKIEHIVSEYGQIKLR